MSEIIIKRNQIAEGNLILIHPSYPLRKEGVNLVQVEVAKSSVELEVRAAIMLKKCLEFSKSSGEVVAISGYRSHTEQVNLFEQSLKENGEAYTRQFVALPGCSEHESGMAVDLAKNADEIDFICPELPRDGIFKNLRKNLVRYGFIERYPQGKETITKISPEPWHFRFVGFPHSAIMTERQLTLEEYLEMLKNKANQKPLCLTLDRTEFEITYYSFEEFEQEKKIEIPERQLYQISGDNDKGIILTTWRTR